MRCRQTLEQMNYQGLKYGIIEVTTACQCRCPGCFMVRRQALDNKFMSLAQAVRVLDICRDYIGWELETMDLLGGEPLLWPFLRPYINILLERGIRPWIFTNMMEITPELAKWLYDRRVIITGKLNINPDDPDQLFSQAQFLQTTIAQAQKMISAIGILRSAGYGEGIFSLENLVRNFNIDQVPEFYRWCLKNNIKPDVELMGCGEGLDEDYWNIAPRPAELAEMIRQIQKVRLEEGLRENDVIMPHIFGHCRFFANGLYFALDGTIRACSNSPVVLAHAEEPEAIKKAYESPLINCRKGLSQEKMGEPCGSCKKFHWCRGGCRATAEGSGDPYAGYELCPVPYL